MPARIDLPRIPEDPGVYLFKDEDGTVLYVGKASNLRARLSQYRQPQDDLRKASMLERATDVEFILTATEKEALLLEASLVRRHKPRFNVRLTDDKRYPFLRLSGGPWPGISICRDTRDLKSDYFGPFPDAGAARQTLEVVREVFRLRNCHELIPGGCLAFQMRLCWAPCVLEGERRVRAVGDGALANANVPTEYAAAANEARSFLRGNVALVTTRLTAEMEEAADRQDFEHAAHMRDRIGGVRATLERQAVFIAGRGNRDVFAVAREGPLAVGVVTLIRNGAVAGQEQFHFRRVPAESTDAELCAEFLRRYYENMPAIPPEIAVEELPPDRRAIEDWLTERRGAGVVVSVPQRGPTADAVSLTKMNAAFHLSQSRLRRGDAEITAEANDIAKVLCLRAPPRRIECIDISHLGGTGVVASLAVLQDGRPDRKSYRRFRLRTQQNDDPASIAEVVGRRILHKEWPMPDILLIDGGTTQLTAAAHAIEAGGEVPWKAVPLASLAKREETIFAWTMGTAVKMGFARDSPGLAAFQRVRDEAHRFAVSYQRRTRAARMTDGALEIPGVGPSRRQALLLHFGGPREVAAASVQELAKVPGIGPATAARIHAALHGG
ncbi:MAG: excinuclease ABC subunit UvrC [Thermoplasmatota archaeon]